MSDPDPRSPFSFDYLPCPAGGGLVLMPCPGRQGQDDRGRVWHRNLDRDLDALRAFPVQAVITLLPDAEIVRYQVTALPQAVASRGWHWWHWPITDMGLAGEESWQAMGDTVPALRAIWQQGGVLAIHCAAGLGRSGTLAAQFLVMQGLDADEAIRQVRQVRPGAIETQAQEQAVRTQRLPV